MTRRFLLFVVLIGFLNGCNRDDICTEDTPATPLLIITFKDINDPTVAKSATNLTIATLDDPSIAVLLSTTTDSIAIPLRTAADITQYNFVLNDIESQTPNIDLVSFNYMRENVYVNRACAFKITYNQFSPSVQDEGAENWIQGFTIIKDTIENENEAHITILH